MVDIHQIMLSLFPTPFDHFHGSAGLVPKLILTLRHMLNLISILTLTFVSEKKVLPSYHLPLHTGNPSRMGEILLDTC